MHEQTKTTKIIKIEITNMLEIPLAYAKAITEWRGDDESFNDDIWDGKIELKQINFECNFRRSTYVCVFEITIGEFLYARTS